MHICAALLGHVYARHRTPPESSTVARRRTGRPAAVEEGVEERGRVGPAGGRGARSWSSERWSGPSRGGEGVRRREVEAARPADVRAPAAAWTTQQAEQVEAGDVGRRGGVAEPRSAG